MDNPWIEIRNSSGHLLFRYNPFTNEIELKKNGYVYDLIRLDEIRAKYNVVVDAYADEKKVDVIVVKEQRSRNV